MKLAKTLAIVACAGLLSAGVVGSARHAYAQDAEETTGAWGAGGTGSDDVDATPDKSKGPPLDVDGCWEGDIHDKRDDLGDAEFEFEQSGASLESGSDFDFEWPDSAFAFGPLTTGTVTANGVKFEGNAGKGCPMHGTLTGDTTELSGKIKFGGKCGKFFKNVTISVSPCPI
ncbi:MAG TPA: hypothetical protein VN865_09860 [Candidatus Acidoferrales bacterium]|nr:hypothetical protein [Candidatus Acidoferrales bacterium]